MVNDISCTKLKFVLIVGCDTQRHPLRSSSLISSSHESWHTLASRTSGPTTCQLTVRNVPDVGAQYIECYYQRSDSRDIHDTRSGGPIVACDARGTTAGQCRRALALWLSLAQFRRTCNTTYAVSRARSFTRASVTFLSLSLLARFLSSSPARRATPIASS